MRSKIGSILKEELVKNSDELEVKKREDGFFIKIPEEFVKAENISDRDNVRVYFLRGDFLES